MPGLTTTERERIAGVLAPYLADDKVRSMAHFVQHGSVSTLEHCQSVAALAWYLNERLHLHADEEVLLVGALLHDFYLYDWHGSGWRHSYRHAEAARRNAVSHFGVGRRTQHVIRCHMWPLGITHVPHTREAILVSIADKIVSLHETLLKRQDKSA